MSGNLYIVSTPIGNLDDITKRAIDTLNLVDIILCEDTRVTRKILNHYDIEKKLFVFNNINENRKAEGILDLINTGSNIALVSDAGTPCISDPGYRLVNMAQKNNINVLTIPGPCSVISALSISGLPTDNFFYQGFLPRKKGRHTKLGDLANLRNLLGTIIIIGSGIYVFFRENVRKTHISSDKPLISTKSSGNFS